MTKIWKKKKKLHPLMREPKCTVAWLIVFWLHKSQQSTFKVMSHWFESQTISQLDSRWFFNVVLNLGELEICLIFVGKLFHKNDNW